MIPAVAILCTLVALGLAVKVFESRHWGVERRSISVRDFPNIAAPLTGEITPTATPPAERAEAA